MAKPYVLVVEDQRAMARALAMYVSALAPVRLAGNVSQAREFLESGDDILAAVLDVSLPDGNGLDLLAELRPRRPLLPVLVLTGRDAWDDVNRAFTLAARYVRKSGDPGSMARMVTSFVLAAMPDAEHALGFIDSFCDRHDLTIRQREVVRLYIQGCPRDGLPSAMRLGENTVKSHVREALRKTQANSLDALCRQILQDAIRRPIQGPASRGGGPGAAAEPDDDAEPQAAAEPDDGAEPQAAAGPPPPTGPQAATEPQAITEPDGGGGPEADGR